MKPHDDDDNGGNESKLLSLPYTHHAKKKGQGQQTVATSAWRREVVLHILIPKLPATSGVTWHIFSLQGRWCVRRWCTSFMVSSASRRASINKVVEKIYVSRKMW